MVKPFIRQHILLSGRRHDCHVPAASDPSQRIDRIKEKGVFDVKKTLAMVLALVMMFTLLTGAAVEAVIPAETAPARNTPGAWR